MKSKLTPDNFCSEFYRVKKDGSFYFSNFAKFNFCIRYTNIIYDNLSDIQKKSLQNKMIQLAINVKMIDNNPWDGIKINIEL